MNAVNRSLVSPLHVASEYNQVEMISLLVSQGAALELQDRESKTALLVAAHRGQDLALQRLIDLGADVTALDREDRSAMYWAADRNNVSSLQVSCQCQHDVADDHDHHDDDDDDDDHDNVVHMYVVMTLDLTT